MKPRCMKLFPGMVKKSQIYSLQTAVGQCTVFFSKIEYLIRESFMVCHRLPWAESSCWCPTLIGDGMLLGLIRVGVISGRGRVSPRGRVGVGGGYTLSLPLYLIQIFSQKFHLKDMDIKTVAPNSKFDLKYLHTVLIRTTWFFKKANSKIKQFLN